VSYCRCGERRRPLAPEVAGTNRRPRQWFVTRRHYSQSAFSGYRREWSDSSDVHCRVCGAYWRTAASYVESLQDCEYFPERNPPAVEPAEEDTL